VMYSYCGLDEVDKGPNIEAKNGMEWNGSLSQIE
jgi:hypothetical protein